MFTTRLYTFCGHRYNVTAHGMVEKDRGAKTPHPSGWIRRRRRMRRMMQSSAICFIVSCSEVLLCELFNTYKTVLTSYVCLLRFQVVCEYMSISGNQLCFCLHLSALLYKCGSLAWECNCLNANISAPHILTLL